MSVRQSSNGLPIGPGHPLYPMLAMVALVGLMFGRAGEDVTDSLPEERTHPYFPDHFWPYPVLAMTVLITLGLLAVIGRPMFQPGLAADPRLAIVARPEWYFLSLFQFVKLGPALITSILVPLALVVGLIFWPLLDATLGPKLARRLAWRSWPVPKRNVITGTLWIGSLATIGLLTLWATLWPQICIPWFVNGPLCGR